MNQELQTPAPTPSLTDIARRLAQLSPEKRRLFRAALRKQGMDDSDLPIVPQPEASQAYVPLSFAQQRLWFLDQLEGGSSAYNICTAQRLLGSLHVPALRAAFAALQQRHGSLRMAIHEKDGTAHLHIHDTGGLPWVEVDLRAHGETERDARLQALASECAQIRFDLTKAPLWQLTLVHLAENEHALFLTLHHIIADGWSLDVLVGELAELYEGFCAGQTARLEPTPITYADYTCWQRDWLQGETLDAQVSYWRNVLGAGEQPILALPTDKARPAQFSQRGAEYVFNINVDVTRRLRELARSEGRTLFSLMLTAFHTLLYRYTGQTDLRIGTPIANRARTETQGLIGLFANTLVIRATPEGNTPFAELWTNTASAIINAQAHQDVPFERLVDLLQPERDLSRSPLFQAMYLQQAKAIAKELPGVRLQPLVTPRETSKFDLTLEVLEGDSLEASFVYATDLFEQTTIQRMATHFQTLLAGIVHNPFARIDQLPLLSPCDEQQLASWNATAVTYPDQTLLHQRVERLAISQPDAPALFFEEVSLSYAGLNNKANQLARFLCEQTIGVDAVVGVCLPRSVDLVVALLAIHKAGAAYLPLDPDYPTDRLDYMLGNANARLLLSRTDNTWTPADADIPFIRMDRDFPRWDTASTHNLDVAVPLDSLAYVIYTSGSTGRPKAVACHHRGLMNRLDWMQGEYALTGCDRVLQKTPFSFDVSVWEFFWPLMTGAALVLARPGEHKDAEQLARLIQDHRITTAHFVPSMLRAFLDEPSSIHCKSLQRVICSGEALAGDLAARFQQSLPAGLHNLYGPTEAAIDVSFWDCKHENGNRAVPIGRPVANTQLHVLDASLNPVPIGVSGELYIGGVQLARGYLGRRGLTAERFVPDPFGPPGARLYRTGDLARWQSDGLIHYLGRLDHQVKIRGFRIELGEIEAQLLAQPEIQDAVVLAREDRPGDKRLVAYWVASGQEGVNGCEELLRARLSDVLPEHMVPAVFWRLEAMPLSPNGKLDRKALPAPDYRTATTAFAAPRNRVESVLARVWAEVLGLPEIGIHDNFFRSGGDSILSLQVVAKARQRGVRLTPKQLFERQTIAELATVAQLVKTRSVSTDIYVDDGQTWPLTPIQHWFFEADFRHPAYWNQAVLLKLREPIAPATLQTAFDWVWQQHPLMNLRMERGETGQWKQRIDATNTLQFHIESVAHLSEAERSAAIRAACESLQASFDLQRGPLVAVKYFDCGDSEPRLFLALHHLLVDGVSWRVLLDDLELACRALLNENIKPNFLHSAPYRHWAEALQKLAHTDAVVAQKDYWLRQTSQPFNPTGFYATDPYGQVGEALRLDFRLDQERTKALLGQAPGKARAHVDEILLAALAQTFCVNGRENMVIELEGHGREGEMLGMDISRTIGWFTSRFPVCLTPGNGDPVSAVKAVKEQLRAIPDKGMCYGLLRFLGDSSTRNAMAAVPIPEICFNYLGRFDRVFNDQSLFSLAPESPGATRLASERRTHALDIDGQVLDDSLCMTWTYSALWLPAEVVEGFAKDFQYRLETMIDALVDAPATVTPSDFPLAKLNQRELDALALDWAAVADLYPLAPMQYGLLLHTLLNPGAGMYLMQDRYRLQGELNVPAFLEGWTAVVERHAVLRTAFVWNNEERPLQAVYRTVPSPVEFLDWSDKDEVNQRAQLESMLAEELHQGFDLAQPRLIRFRLIRLGPDSYYFTQSYHHILIDAWCFSLLMVDFFAIYRALSEGNEAPRLKPVRPYRDFIAWLGARDQREDRQWWRQTLAGFESPTPLMIKKTPEQQVHRGVEDRSVQLSVAETQALQAEAQKRGLTTNTYVQAAWALALAWYSGQRDILFGVTVAGRPPELEGVEETIGLFINTLPLRLKIAPEVTVGTWLRELLAQNMELRQYEQLPLSEVQAESPLGRGQSLFDSLFVFENAPVDRSLDEWKERFHIDDKHARTHTNYPITVVIIPGEQLILQLTYDRELFDEPAIFKLLDHFKHLLLQLMHHPETKLTDLQRLSNPELEQIRAWNDTGSDDDIPDSYASLFEAQVRATPQAIAARCAGETLRYKELNRRANRIARALAAVGVGPDTVVPLSNRRGLDLLAMILGVLKTGAAYLPLDINHPPQRLAQILRQSNARVVLTGVKAPSLHEALHLMDRSLPNNPLEVLDLGSIALEMTSDEDDINPPAQGHSNNLGYVIFTSGSTGVPKGAMVDRRGMLNNLLQKQPQLGLTSGDVVAQTASACFDISVWQFLSGLLCGASIEIVPDEIAHDPRALLRHVADTGITILETVPSLLRGILAEAETAVSAELKLRWVLPTGEALPPDLARAWLTRHPQIPLLNVYGPAECADDVAVHPLFTEPDSEAHLPIGRPVANLRLYVLNSELEVLPTGVPGELCIAGVGVGRGYLNDPVRTAQAFIPHPLADAPGERLYRTGDLVRQNEDGVFEYLGRIDHQVKLRGYRIELGEIEARLLALPSIAQAVVTVREDRPGDQKLVAYVVGQADSEGVRASLSDTLPQYMVPSVYVYLDKLPLNPNGKIDRKALPAPDVTGQDAAIEAPIGDIEVTLAQIWRDVLGIDQVGRHQNFFALGGHSLLATQLASRVRRLLGIELPLRAVFDAPTIAQLGLALESSGEDSAPPLVPTYQGGPAPLSFAQERMWFLNELAPDGGLHNMPIAVALTGKLNIDALARSFELLARRHSVLRSGIAADKQLQMIPLSLPPFELPIDDLRALPEPTRELEARRLSTEEARRGFDLTRAAPWRGRLLQLDDNHHWLLLTIHHIAGDGWSLGILTRELALIYSELNAGREPVLPRLPIQYADYAIWQRQWLEGNILNQQLAYWRNQLGQANVSLELPTDRPRPPVQTSNGATLQINISQELHLGLKQVSERHGATLYMTLLAGFSLLLHRYSGQSDVRVGTPIANRHRVETEGLVGLLANTLVIRSQLNAGMALAEFLYRTKENALGAQANQDLPFEHLVGALQPERDLSRSPLFQAMFILQNAPQGELTLPDLDVQVLPVEHGHAEFDLTLMMSERSGELDASLEYNTDLFDPDTAKRFADSLKSLLTQLAAEKATPLEAWLL